MQIEISLGNTPERIDAGDLEKGDFGVSEKGSLFYRNDDGLFLISSTGFLTNVAEDCPISVDVLAPGTVIRLTITT